MAMRGLCSTYYVEAPARPRVRLVCKSVHPAGTLLGTKANGFDTAWLSAPYASDYY